MCVMLYHVKYSMSKVPSKIYYHDHLHNCCLRVLVCFDDRIQYPAIQTVTHSGRTLLLHAVDDCGGPVSQTFQLHSSTAANALYRAMTEVYSFYRCDTVGSNVTTQFCRDLKGTLASLFNENTDLGER